MGAAATAAASIPGVKPQKSVEELRRKFVKVPKDPGMANASCPVCKETFKAEWSEDEEEWVWKNAINISGKVS